MRKGGSASTTKGNPETHSVASPVFASGLRVRLFLEEDIPELVRKARRSLAKDATSGQIPRTLDPAFFGAHFGAEQERVALPPFEQEGKCKAVADNGRQLLRRLGLPSDPKAYTKEGSQWLRHLRGDPFRKSAIAYRSKRTCAPSANWRVGKQRRRRPATVQPRSRPPHCSAGSWPSISVAGPDASRTRSGAPSPRRSIAAWRRCLETSLPRSRQTWLRRDLNSAVRER